MTRLTPLMMRQAVEAITLAGKLHAERMADPTYVAIMEGRACPLPLPYWTREIDKNDQ